MTRDDITKTKISVFTHLISSKTGKNLKFIANEEKKEGTFTPEDYKTESFRYMMCRLTNLKLDETLDIHPLVELIEIKDGKTDFRLRPIIEYNSNLNLLAPDKYSARITSGFIVPLSSLTSFADVDYKVSIGKIVGFENSFRSKRFDWNLFGECCFSFFNKKPEFLLWKQMECKPQEI